MSLNENSIIDSIVKDIKILPTLSDYGLVNATTVEVEPQRRVGSDDPTGLLPDKWSRGLIDLQWSVSSGKRWIPKSSYLKTTAALTVNDLQPSASDAITFASNFMNNLVSSCTFMIGNKVVSRIEDYVGQTSMVKYRCEKDLSWLSTIGRDVRFIIPSFGERQRRTASDGHLKDTPYTALGYDDNNTITSVDATHIQFAQGAGGVLPALNTTFSVGDRITYKQLISPGANFHSAKITGIDNGTNILTLEAPGVPVAAAITMLFSEMYRSRDSQDAPRPVDAKNIVQICWQLPMGIFDTEAILPQGEFRLKIVPKNDKIAGVETSTGAPLPAGWKLNIIDFKLVNCIFSSTKAFADSDYYLVLNEWQLQNRKLNPGASLTTHNWTLPSTTTKIVVFAQDSSSGSVEVPHIPPSVFKAQTINTALDLRHITLTFGGQTKPTSLFDSSFTEGVQNVTQRYFWNSQNNRLDVVGGETFESWLDGGLIYATEFYRVAGDKSTQLQLQLDYGDMTNECEVFVAANCRNVVKISTEGGLVTQVLVQES